MCRIKLGFIACGGFDRVFEIGPVFRAENSNTHRHLCEFTGLDFEMAIIEHYYEALEMMGNMFIYMFDGIADRFHNELVVISQQYPFEPISYPRTSLRITFQEGIALLQVMGTNCIDYSRVSLRLLQFVCRRLESLRPMMTISARLTRRSSDAS